MENKPRSETSEQNFFSSSLPPPSPLHFRAHHVWLKGRVCATLSGEKHDLISRQLALFLCAVVTAD